ncbi:MAG: DUF5611 family protein [Candidatus Thermoplasmatota archaeon]|jgi:hypothetical protein|nr:DUF5611 family protein [Candidatus Thermoplasmatota archaeon]
MAREYPVKKGLKTDPDTILSSAKELGIAGKIENSHVLLSIPGIRKIDIFNEGKKLMVETENEDKNPDPMKTLRMFNDLMEKITGYSSKERKKKFSKL